MTLSVETCREDARARRPVRFRSPSARDGAAIWQLVRESGALEPNTCYAYLLLCTDFAGTCLVAERGGELLGFVAAYRPPARPEAVFVWQIGVRAEARGTGLGTRLLHRLMALPACAGARYLEATVTPSNDPSQRLFRGFARAREAALEVCVGFTSEHFGALAHEREDRLRIGPLRREA